MHLRGRKQRLLQTLLTNLFIYLEPLTQLVKELAWIGLVLQPERPSRFGNYLASPNRHCRLITGNAVQYQIGSRLFEGALTILSPLREREASK